MNLTMNNGRPANGRLYQRVAKQLAAVIADGEYPPGSRLPAERKLAERFEVSRPTVREAVIALELAGFVEVRRGSGVYICEASKDNLPNSNKLDVGPFDIFEAIIMVEGEAAKLAAKNVTDEDLTEIRQALHDMVARNTAAPATELADERFHLLIARATKNEVIANVCSQLWSLRNSSPVSARILEKVRQVGSQPRIEEHKAILDALERRDGRAARKAMREHLTRVIQQMLDATEAEAIEEARREVMHKRKRFGAID